MLVNVFWLEKLKFYFALNIKMDFQRDSAALPL